MFDNRVPQMEKPMAQDRNLPSREEWLNSANKNPDDFDDEHGVEAMTDEQAHRLKALAWRLGVPFERDLDREQADRRIRELEARS